MLMTLAMKRSSQSAPSIVMRPFCTASSKSMDVTPVKMSIVSSSLAMAAACWGGSCAPSDQ